MITQAFSNVPTKRYAWLAVLGCVLGYALDKATEPLWVHLGIRAPALEYIGAGLFWLGYAVLWLLLPIAAFRPDSRFYYGGDCALRWRRAGFVLALLALVHGWLLISLIVLARALGGVAV